MLQKQLLCYLILVLWIEMVQAYCRTIQKKKKTSEKQALLVWNLEAKCCSLMDLQPYCIHLKFQNHYKTCEMLIPKTALCNKKDIFLNILLLVWYHNVIVKLIIGLINILFLEISLVLYLGWFGLKKNEIAREFNETE